MEKMIARAGQTSGTALDRHTFELTGAPLAKLRQMIHVKINIVRDEQVQFAVIVIIKKCSARRPTRSANTGLLSYISKAAVAVVVIQMVLSQASHKEIVKTVVIVVSNCHAHSPTNIGEA